MSKKSVNDINAKKTKLTNEDKEALIEVNNESFKNKPKHVKVNVIGKTNDKNKNNNNSSDNSNNDNKDNKDNNKINDTSNIKFSPFNGISTDMQDKAQSNASNKDVRKIRNFDMTSSNGNEDKLKLATSAGMSGLNIASSALKGAGRDALADEQKEDKDGKRYQNDLDNLATQTANGARRVNDFISDIKRQKAINSKYGDSSKAHDAIQNVDSSVLNKNDGINPSEKELIKNKALKDAYKAPDNIFPQNKVSRDDKDKLINNADKLRQADMTRKELDRRFGTPKKRDSIAKVIKKRFKEYKDKKKKKLADIKKKGVIKSFIEKVIGSGESKFVAPFLEVVIIIILILLGLTLVIIIVFFFSNNYAREQDDIKDSKRLDTRVANAIFSYGYDAQVEKTYDELIKESVGAKKERYKSNKKSLLPSSNVKKLRDTENVKSGFILQDSAEWVLLYIERLTYAWGGYLNWTPDYLSLNVTIGGGSLKNASGEAVERWRPIAEKIGAQYGIDPALLLALVDIESSGDPHVGNANYKGLAALGAGFSDYFEDGEEFKNYSPDMRIPKDIGSCDYLDENHQKNAELHFTYLARRIGKEAKNFLNNKKSVAATSATDKDKIVAILYSLTAYNQGAGYQSDFYNAYGDSAYLGDGSIYLDKYNYHRNVPLPGKHGFKSIGAQGHYLKLAYKLYSSYSGGRNLSESSVMFDASKWYGKDKILGKNSSKTSTKEIEDKYEVSTDVLPEVKLGKNDSERDLIATILKKYEEAKKKYIVNQYNRWQAKLDAYYMKNYPDKFISNGQGGFLPELYAKDAYGNDTADVIKHKSFIHNAINTINTYTLDKTYSGDKSSCYNQLASDLNAEVNGNLVSSRYEQGEKLADLESELGISRYEMNFEVLRTLDAKNDIFKSSEAMETIRKSLSYSVPIFEYASFNRDLGYKSFFDYEIYNKDSYNKNYTLKIDKNKFLKKANEINKIDVTLTDFVKKGWTKKGQIDIETRMEKAFDAMYLSKDKIFEPKNHYVEVPSNLNYFYIVKGSKVYDRMIEKVRAIEVYESGEIPAGARVEWEYSPSSVNASTFKELKTTTTRDYYTSTLKPSKFQSLKYEITFDYITMNEGDRNVSQKDGQETCYIGKVYVKKASGDDSQGSNNSNKNNTLKNNSNTSSGDAQNISSDDEEFYGYVYRKEVAKNSHYIVEKVRNKTVSKRGAEKQ